MNNFYPNQEVLYEPAEEHMVQTFYIKDMIPAIFIKYINDREKAKIKLLDSQTFDVDPNALKLRQCSDMEVYQAYLKPQHANIFTKTCNLLSFYLRNIKRNVIIDRFYMYYTLDFTIDEFKGTKLLIHDPKAMLNCLKSLPQLQKYVKEQMQYQTTIRIYTKQNYVYVNQMVLQASQLGMKVPWLPIITFHADENMFNEAITNNYEADKQVFVIINAQQIIKNENNLIFIYNIVKNSRNDINIKQNIKQNVTSSQKSTVNQKQQQEQEQQIRQFPPNSTLQYLPGSIKAQKQSASQKLTQSKYNEITSPKYHYQMPLSVKLQTSIMNGNFYKNISKSQSQSKVSISKILTSSLPNKYIEAFEQKLKSRVYSEYTDDKLDDIDNLYVATVQSTLVGNQALSIQTELAAYDVLRNEINQYEHVSSEGIDDVDTSYTIPLGQSSKSIMFIKSLHKAERVTKSEINLDDLVVDQKYVKREGVNKCAIAKKPQLDIDGMMSQLATQDSSKDQNQNAKQKQPQKQNVSDNVSKNTKTSQRKQTTNINAKQAKQQNSQNLKQLPMKEKPEPKQHDQQAPTQPKDTSSTKTDNQQTNDKINEAKADFEAYPAQKNQEVPMQDQQLTNLNAIKQNNIKNDDFTEIPRKLQKSTQEVRREATQQSNNERPKEENQVKNDKKNVQTTENLNKEIVKPKKLPGNKNQEENQIIQQNDSQTSQNNDNLTNQLEKHESLQLFHLPPSPAKSAVDTADGGSEDAELQGTSKEEDKDNFLPIEEEKAQSQAQNNEKQLKNEQFETQQSEQIDQSCTLSYQYEQPPNVEKVIHESNQQESQLSYIYNEESPVIKQNINQQQNTMKIDNNANSKELRKDATNNDAQTQMQENQQQISLQIKELQIINFGKAFNFDNNKLQDINILSPQTKSNEQIKNLLNKTINTYNKVNQKLNMNTQSANDTEEISQNTQPPESQKIDTLQVKPEQQYNSSIDTDIIINKLLNSKKQVKRQPVKTLEEQIIQKKDDAFSTSSKQLQQQLDQIESSHTITSIYIPQTNISEPYELMQANTSDNVPDTSYAQYQLSQTSPKETDQSAKSQSQSKFQLSDKIHLKTIGISQILQTEKDHVSLSLRLQKGLQQSE